MLAAWYAVARQSARFPAFDGSIVATQMARDRFPPVQSLFALPDCDAIGYESGLHRN
jgi:hypothetical protein